jgi:membrane protein implicated in regulation of membrane protease activity
MIWETWHMWTASALALLILEVFMPGFVLACLGIGAFGGALAAWLGATFEWQLIASAVTGLVAFVFLRPVMLKMGFTGDETLSGTDALIGRESIVTLEFEPASGFGRVKIDGDDWRAKIRSTNQTSGIKKGQVLIIKDVESNTLIVAPKD